MPQYVQGCGNFGADPNPPLTESNRLSRVWTPLWMHPVPGREPDSLWVVETSFEIASMTFELWSPMRSWLLFHWMRMCDGTSTQSQLLHVTKWNACVHACPHTHAHARKHAYIPAQQLFSTGLQILVVQKNQQVGNRFPLEKASVQGSRKHSLANPHLPG